MATTISTGNSDNDTITGVRIDIARLEGMLTSFLTDGVRRIENGEKVSEKIRTDLTAVKEGCHSDLAVVASKVTINTENIKELREDIKDIREKQNASFGRILLIMSPIISAAALLWNMIGK